MRKIKIAFRMLLFVLMSRHFGRRGIDEKKLFFVSDVSDMLQGNMETVYNFINNNERLKSEYHCEVFCKSKQKNAFTMSDIRRIAEGLATSKYVFLEDVLDYLEFAPDRDGQEIVQLWHGAGAYKMFGFSRPDGQTGDVRVSRGHRKYTKAIVSSEEIRWCYAEAFGIDESRVAATGIPRTDVFFDEKYKAEARARFFELHPEATGKKIVFFAPTYRGSRISDAAYDFSKLDFGLLKEQLGDGYLIVFKWHPAMYNNILLGRCKTPDLKKYGGYYLDLSDEQYINDLLMVTDILVTDYSSIIFEYALTGKPIVYFAYDRDTYSGTRGMYYPFEDYVFGEVAVNQEELVKAIKAENICPDKRKTFIDRFMSACDGKAAKKTCVCVLGTAMLK